MVEIVISILALTVSLLSLCISVFNTCISNKSKIQVNVTRVNEDAAKEQNAPIGDDWTYYMATIVNLSRRTKHIQSIKVKYPRPLRNNSTNDSLYLDMTHRTLEPESLIMVPLHFAQAHWPTKPFTDSPTFFNNDPLYIVVTDTSGKQWVSKESIPLMCLILAIRSDEEKQRKRECPNNTY